MSLLSPLPAAIATAVVAVDITAACCHRCRLLPSLLLAAITVVVIGAAYPIAELPGSSDESMETLSLSKENEVEEVDPQQPEMQLGDSDEEEYTSDQNESDNEDVNAEFDICPTSEDEMENIWFEDDMRLLQVGGEMEVGGDLLPFLHLHHRQETYNLCTSTNGRTTTSAPLPAVAGPMTYASPSQMASGSTPPPSEPVHADDETSHHEGEGSYNEMMRAVWINEGGIIDSQSIQMSYVLDLHGQPLQEQISNIFCIMFEEMQKNCDLFEKHEAQLKRPPQFQEPFDETPKKKGMNDYISEKAREVAESYKRGMDERYGDDSQRLELDPDIWVAVYGASKNGHVYGFGHSLGTARVLSSCSSSISHVTSPFTTPTAPGGSSNASPTMTPDQVREIVNESVSQNISTIVSQTVSQMLAQMGILRDRAPPAQQPLVSILFY
ncbi:hypothetical protein Taro_050255 [Colocasia esculenta]|uniref:Uncharacterized protein n=1 Tax=Colocasia esculenta TaxID=4460 RepID=A0A843XDD2_COLES|nr:hypothetical protein [Colocasia esculenta]